MLASPIQAAYLPSAESLEAGGELILGHGDFRLAMHQQQLLPALRPS